MKPGISGHEMPAGAGREGEGRVRLRLYVSDWTPNSLAAFANAGEILRERLKGRYSLEVIDIRENPQVSIEAGIVMTPLLERFFPDPRQKRRKVIGTLSNREKVLAGLGL
jgi:circadian clock protein KaiB